jgi:hypothetical protein
VIAAAVGAAAAVAATALGWRRRAGIGRAAAMRGALVASALVLSVAAPASFAATAHRPLPQALPAETLRLAHLAETDASMPARVRAAERRVEAMEDRGADLRSRADLAYDEWDRLDALRTSAVDRSEKATRGIQIWTGRLASAQDDYDIYQELLQPLDGYGSGDYNYNYDLPELPNYDGAPTTDDFGTGTGSIGLCNDGTLSDSIGRPGACSHHGGVP